VRYRTFIRRSTAFYSLGTRQVQDLVKGYQLEREVTQVTAFPEAERTQSTIFIEALSVPDPKALAKQAIEEGWLPNLSEKPYPSLPLRLPLPGQPFCLGDLSGRHFLFNYTSHLPRVLSHLPRIVLP